MSEGGRYRLEDRYLADEGTVPAAKVAEAIARYALDTEKINPLYA